MAKKGEITTNSRLGEKYLTNEGYEIEIIEYFGCMNCTIIFNDKERAVINNTTYSCLKKGQISNPYHPSVCGVGYFGIGSFKAKVNGEKTPHYESWSRIIKRCYSEKSQKRNPTYISCVVDESWHNFQNFAEWYEENYNPEIMQGWHLDKDILVKGNKVYSSETCCFVPQEINKLFKFYNSNTNYPTGVGFHKRDKKYVLTSFRSKYLGYFETLDSAFHKHKEMKEKHIKEVADKWKGQISDEVYQAMYNYQVEITD
jgi:hypothetical protein